MSLFSVSFCFLLHVQLQALSLGIFRSDYLAHMSEDNAIKQVEINTIASSFGGISTHMLPLQRYFQIFFLSILVHNLQY